MSDAEAEKIYDDMLQMFVCLPHIEHEPKRFEFYVRLYKYIKSIEANQQTK